MRTEETKLEGILSSEHMKTGFIITKRKEESRYFRSKKKVKN